MLINQVVRPWLDKNFDLPKDYSANPDYKMLNRLAAWATERAKIELSANGNTIISLSETETRTKDLKNQDIYLDIPLQRYVYDRIIAKMLEESVHAARDLLTKAGIRSYDLNRVVFVGGPTQYKPLRDKISFMLGISANIDINPMTAVAEEASLFAKSIDWSTSSRDRKSIRGQSKAQGKLALQFNYIARTPDLRTKIVVQLAEQIPEGTEFQIDSVDTGWTSGRKKCSIVLLLSYL